MNGSSLYTGGRKSLRFVNNRVVHTNIRVLPEFATFLRQSLKSPALKEKFKFHISQSQVYTDGKCEILAIKSNINTPDSMIINHVSLLISAFDGKTGEHVDVVECLKGITLPNPSLECTSSKELEAKTPTNDDSLIEVTDAEDSVCILPSPISHEKRKLCLNDALLPSSSVNDDFLNSSCAIIENTINSLQPSNKNILSAPPLPRVTEDDCEADVSVIIVDNLDDSCQPLTSCNSKSKKMETLKSTLSSEKYSPNSNEKLKCTINKKKNLLEAVTSVVEAVISGEKRIPEQGRNTSVECLEKCNKVSLNNTKSNLTHSPMVVDPDDSSDEIVIEKEFSKNPLKAVTVEDSDDDDIMVCEVKCSNVKKRKKVAFAPDYIPLVDGNRMKKRKITSAPDFIPLLSNVGETYHQKKKRSKKNAFGTSKNSKIKNKSKRLNVSGKQEMNHLGIRNDTNEPISINVGAEKKSDAKMNEDEMKKNSPGKCSKNAESEGSERKSDPNIINPNALEVPKSELRPVIIDANNVAAGHGRGGFSPLGVRICIKYFQDRGHKVVAFVPKFRRFHISPEDRKSLDDLEKEGVISYTPSRTMPDGRKIASYDDRFIVQAACELGGVIVSTDNYRDLLAENERWRETIEKRLLMFTWVGDMLMFPEDPLGRQGPKLSDFLRFSPPKKQKEKNSKK